MGLLKAIPGLSAHQVDETGSAPVAELDIEAGSRMIGEALGLIKSLYPCGASEWLRENRPDVLQFITGAEADINAAGLAGDRARLARALDVWVAAHKKAFALFEGKPPVIERQESLFEGRS